MDTSKMQTYDAPIGAILSIVTGKLIPSGDNGNGFDELQALAEFLARRPVWTHELGSKNLAEDLATRCKNAIPTDIASEDGALVNDAETAIALRVKWEAVYGATLTLEAPVGESDISSFGEMLPKLGKGRNAN